MNKTELPHTNLPVFFFDFKNNDVVLKEVMEKIHPTLTRYEQIALEIYVEEIKDKMYWICRAEMMDLQETVTIEVKETQEDVKNLIGFYFV